MSKKPSLEEQELLAETFRRDHEPMAAAELRAAYALSVGLLLLVGCLWLMRPPGSIGVWPAALSMIVLLLASRVRFDTPFGFTVPTQLGFVPLVFSLPPALVPLAVLVALSLSRLPDVFAGRTHPSRLLQSSGNSWFAVGPAAVFVLAGTEPQRAGAGLLLAALAAQFVVDFVLSTAHTQSVTDTTFTTQLREVWVYGVDAALSGVALVVAVHAEAKPLAVLSLVPLLGLFALFAHERHHRLESLVELNNAYRGTALVLGDVVEADDGYTGQHCKGVVALALQVAARLGLDAERRRNLEFAALLHDIGKIAIPKEIVGKASALDPEEWTIIKTHTVEGQRMLERVGGFMREVGQVVRSHHERWDGKGYPDCLAGEQIPLEARIISACDAWNAMRTDRPYRNALDHDVALAELRANCGSQFDPHVIDALVRIVDDVPQPSPAGEQRARAHVASLPSGA